jgi:hypothetical protein
VENLAYLQKRCLFGSHQFQFHCLCLEFHSHHKLARADALLPSHTSILRNHCGFVKISVAYSPSGVAYECPFVTAVPAFASYRCRQRIPIGHPTFHCFFAKQAVSRGPRRGQSSPFAAPISPSAIHWHHTHDATRASSRILPLWLLVCAGLVNLVWLRLSGALCTDEMDGAKGRFAEGLRASALAHKMGVL